MKEEIRFEILKRLIKHIKDNKIKRAANYIYYPDYDLIKLAKYYTIDIKDLKI